MSRNRLQLSLYTVIKQNGLLLLTSVPEGVELHVWYQMKGWFSDYTLVKFDGHSFSRFREISSLVDVLGALFATAR